MISGRLVNVNTAYLGSTLTSAYTAGDLELYVANLALFNSSGYLQVIGELSNEIVPYTCVFGETDSTSYIKLGTALVGSYAVEKDIYLFPFKIIKIGEVTTELGTVTALIDTRLWAMVDDGIRNDELTPDPLDTYPPAEDVVIENNVITAIVNNYPTIDGLYTKERSLTADKLVVDTITAASGVIHDLSANIIDAGTLDASLVTIQSQDNHVILDLDGLRIYKASDPTTYVDFNANDPQGRVIKIFKGGIYIENADESLLLDENGITADGIVRGIMPGSNNPILNSSFEKVTGGGTPSYWIADTGAEWGDTSDPLPKRTGLTNAEISGNTTILTAPALVVKEETDGGFTFTGGTWSNDTDASHSGGAAKLSYRNSDVVVSDVFTRADGPIGNGWLNWDSSTYVKANCPIESNQVVATEWLGTELLFGGRYDSIISAGNLAHSYIQAKFKESLMDDCVVGIGRNYNGLDNSPYTVYAYHTGGNLVVRNGDNSQTASTSYSPGNDTDFYLRISFEGDKVRVYTSPNGTSWTYRLTITITNLTSYSGKAGFWGGVYTSAVVSLDDFYVYTATGIAQPYATYTLAAGIRGCKVYVKKHSSAGKLHVLVDDVPISDSPFDMYNASSQYQQVLASITGLNPLTSHVLKLQLDSEFNTAAQYFPSIHFDKLGLSGEGLITMQNDLTSVPTDWSFAHSTNTPSNSAITTLFRSSVNGTDWSSWTDTFTSVPLRRYIEVKELLTSYDGTANPTLNSFTLTYTLSGSPIPTNWTAAGTGSANIATTVSDFKFGTKCFYCNNSTATDAKAYQIISVKKNMDYVISGYYKSNALSSYTFGGGNHFGELLFGEGTTNGVNIRVRKNLGGDILTETTLLNAADWTRFIAESFNTADCETIVVEINVGEVDAEVSGELFIDAIMLNEGTVVQPWSIGLYDWLDHTSSQDIAGAVHHTLGTGQYQSAAGNHTHTGWLTHQQVMSRIFLGA